MLSIRAVSLVVSFRLIHPFQNIVGYTCDPTKCGEQRFKQTIFTYPGTSGRRIVIGNTKKEVDLAEHMHTFPKSPEGLGSGKKMSQPADKFKE
jgi:hypothetical protein